MLARKKPCTFLLELHYAKGIIGIFTMLSLYVQKKWHIPAFIQALEPPSNPPTYIGSPVNEMLSDISNSFLCTSLLPTNLFTVLNTECV